MKKISILLIILVLMLPMSLFAGEKEELQLKQQMLQERLARIEMQVQLLQILHQQTNEELKKVNERLQEIEKKKEK